MSLTLESIPVALSPLQRILALRSISTHFQPIVSVKRKAVVGVEALARTQDPASGASIPPPLLFQWAREDGQLKQLDQLCQEQALAAFSGLPRREPEMLLFMNVEASQLDEDPDFSLLRTAHQAGVKPCNIVIEVNETKVLDPQRLAEFVERHRRLGFLIAMDDLGSGHSSLQRWPVLKPDIIKLDRSLVDGVAGNFFAQELLRSLIALGRQTGALILAEGVETQADITTCMDLGVDLFQGYFFAKPAPIGARNLEQALEAALDCAAGHKGRALDRMMRRRNDYQEHSKVARALALQLIQAPADSFDAVLRLAPAPKGVESMLLLDERGMQVTSVSFPNGQTQRQRASLFQAPKAGADHSDRDYFYGLIESATGRDFFLTECHLSVTTGQPVRTLSHNFQHPCGASFVVCLDLRVQAI